MIDRNAVNRFEQIMQEAAKRILTETGLTVKLGTIKWEAESLRVGVEAKRADLKVHETRIGKDFLAYAESYGFQPSDLGREFHAGNKRFRLVGMNLGNPKNVMALEEVATGKTYRSPASYVSNALGLKRRA